MLGGLTVGASTLLCLLGQWVEFMVGIFFEPEFGSGFGDKLGDSGTKVQSVLEIDILK